MKSYSGSIRKIPITLELNEDGFWVRYKKSQSSEEFEKILDEISSSGDEIALVLEKLIGKGELRVE